jgi:hypothetical protein
VNSAISPRAIVPQLNPENLRQQTQLLKALTCVYRLNDLGVHVRALDFVTASVPVLWIHPHPHVSGALCSRWPTAQGNQGVRVTELAGCQVRWIQRETPADIAEASDD